MRIVKELKKKKEKEGKIRGEEEWPDGPLEFA